MLSFSIPQNHPSFAGHFPGNPIVPGVLLLERVMAYAQSQTNIPLEHCALLNVKFLASVAPGDELNLTLSESTADNFVFAVYIENGSAGSQGTLACSGQLRRMVD
jgi:3-hydroxymyristoyl/3-hydroxydecanoyl-(acyl carrier protein) dehydratase